MSDSKHCPVPCLVRAGWPIRLLCLATGLAAAWGVAATPSIRLDTYLDGLQRPVAIAHAGDARLFVAEQAGRILVSSAAGRHQTFLDIAGRVESGGEQGLLGLAFHPDHAANGYLYVYYTRRAGGELRSRVARFSAGGGAGRADPDSERVVLEFAQPYGNHNGGDLAFGPDGYLYVASGDGGSGGDPHNFAQRVDTLLGKLLRIDVDGAGGADCALAGADVGYGIPPDNAYVDGPGGAGCDEIYALGLRNPWRIGFDRDSGDLWIGDVGQNAFEEIDRIAAGSVGGLNLGWRCREGDRPFDGGCAGGDFLQPVLTLPHSAGDCSVTGGRVYRGGRHPALFGRYVFSDYCNGAVRTLDADAPAAAVAGSLGEALPAGAVRAPSTFGEDVDGELYVASLSDGRVSRVEGVAGQQDSAGAGVLDAGLSADPISGPAPLTVTFDAAASTGPVAAYAFDFGDFEGLYGDGATVSHTYDEPGRHTVLLAVFDATGAAEYAGTVVEVEAAVAGGTTAGLRVTPDRGRAPLTVELRATTPAPGLELDYSFDFGNFQGVYGDASSVRYTYTEPGVYTAVLSIVDRVGNVASYAATVTVTAN